MKNFAPDLEFVAKELAPLEAISKKKLPEGMSETDALRIFMAMTSSTCPMLAHLTEYGFNLKTLRAFLSAYAGQRLEIPSRRVIAKNWVDLQFWLSVEQRLQGRKGLVEAIQHTASRLGVPSKRVGEAHGRFKLAQEALTKR